MNIPKIIQFDIVEAARERAETLRADLEVLRHDKGIPDKWKASAMADAEARIKALDALCEEWEG